MISFFSLDKMGPELENLKDGRRDGLDGLFKNITFFGRDS